MTGWLRLHDVESATTMRYERGRTLLTDGPFIDSKDYLGGLIVIEAENLDGALAVAGELQQLRGSGAIEVRPVREGELDRCLSRSSASTGAASWRRSSAISATSSWPKTPPRKRSRSPPNAGRATEPRPTRPGG